MSGPRLMTVVDAVAVAFGLVLLIAAVANVSQAEAAQTSALLFSSKASQPWGVFLGSTLTAFPFIRRFAHHALMDGHDMAECAKVGQELHRIALQQRVQTGNLYLVDMPDEVVRRAFDDPQGLWHWLSPAYEDAALRRQIHPRLLARLEAMAREQDDGATPQG